MIYSPLRCKHDDATTMRGLNHKSPSAFDFNSLDPDIERLMRLGNMPGLSIAIVRSKKVIFAKGYGYANLEEQRVATASTVYPIASITKGFTAAACGLLVADGRLAWDDPIVNYVPDFSADIDPIIRAEANLIDVLSHRTGIGDQVSLYCAPNGEPWFDDTDTLMRTMGSMPAPSNYFRKFWSYNPLMYALTTHIIERLSGQSLNTFFKDRIFEPLGMQSTTLIGFETKDSSTSERAFPYTATNDGRFLRRQVPPSAYQFPYDTSMGISSSAEDMAIWCQAVIHAYRAKNETGKDDSGSPSVLRSMETILHPFCPLPSTKGGESAYGLGWFIHDGHFIFDDIFDIEESEDSLPWPCTFPVVDPAQKSQKILYHSGLGNGFTSSLHIYPEIGDAVVILGNSSNAGDAVDSISRLLTARLCDHDLSIAELERNLALYAKLELSRWKSHRDDLLHAKIARSQSSTPLAENLAGRFVNKETGLVFNIKVSTLDSNMEPSWMGSWIGASLAFGDVTTVNLQLWAFCDSTVCFFPNEETFQRWGLCYLKHWAQFLLHISYHEESSHVVGLWWQFNHRKDGIWFEKKLSRD